MLNLSLFLLAVLVGQGSCYFGLRPYIEVEFTVGRDHYAARSAIASYSNRTFDEVSGILHPESLDFGCVSSRTTANSSLYPSEPFVMFIPLSSSCRDYQQAAAAQSAGAVGVILYTSTEQRRLQNTKTPRLGIPVAFIYISSRTSNLFRGMSSVSATLSLRFLQQSQTFYFVVFAFSLLVLLSMTWFFVTYTKRLVQRCKIRKRKVATQRTMERVISQLPVRTIKKNKKYQGEDDESLCAICLEGFMISDCVRTLPCKHEFHKQCIDPWLQSKSTCPLCKFNIVSGKQESPCHTVTPSSAFFGIHTNSPNETRRDDVDIEAQRTAVGDVSDSTASGV